MYNDPEGIVYPQTEATATPGNNLFISANRADALSYMQSSYRKVYNDDREISSLDYRINISTQLNLLNSGSSQAALMADQVSGDTYNA